MPESDILKSTRGEPSYLRTVPFDDSDISICPTDELLATASSWLLGSPGAKYCVLHKIHTFFMVGHAKHVRDGRGSGVTR